MAAQQNTAQDSQSSAVVIAFPESRQRPPVRTQARRLTLRDRVETMRWADAVRQRGISRAAIHSAGNSGDANLGDFILVYLAGALWANWVVGCKPQGYCVWRAGSGADLGCFATLGEALAAIEVLV